VKFAESSLKWRESGDFIVRNSAFRVKVLVSLALSPPVSGLNGRQSDTADASARRLVDSSSWQIAIRERLQATRES